MNNRLVIPAVLLASAAIGAGAGVLVSQAGVSSDQQHDVSSIAGVGSGVDGMQSIRGIKGIDTVVLQNLEAVLRMQAPPLPPTDGGGGGGRAAAELLTTQPDAPPDPEEEPDGREELQEFELEGS